MLTEAKKLKQHIKNVLPSLSSVFYFLSDFWWSLNYDSWDQALFGFSSSKNQTLIIFRYVALLFLMELILVLRNILLKEAISGEGWAFFSVLSSCTHWCWLILLKRTEIGRIFFHYDLPFAAKMRRSILEQIEDIQLHVPGGSTHPATNCCA